MSDMSTHKLWPVLVVLVLLVAGAAVVEAYAEHRGAEVMLVRITGGQVAFGDDETQDDDDAAPDDASPLSDAHARARLAARRGELDSALATFSQEVARHPAAARLRAERGYWLLVARRADEARADLERAHELEPADPRIALNLGVARRRTGDLAGAEAAFRRALELRPAYGGAQVALGSLLRRRGSLKEAISVLSAAAHSGGNQERALASVALGRSYLAANLRAEADEAFTQAINWAPAEAEVRISVANAFLADGQRDDTARAVDVLRRAIELAPDLPRAHSTLGRALERRGESEAAEAAYERALRLEPSYVFVMRRLLRLALDRGIFARARMYADRLIDAAPDDAEHYFLAGLVAAHSGKRDSARDFYGAAIARAGGDYPEAYLNLGLNEKNGGDLEAAVAAYAKAIELRPGYVAALNSLGVAQAARGNAGAAESAYRRAIETDPRYSAAWLNLGRLLREQERFDEAVLAIKKALDSSPGYEDAWLSLGVTYARAERPDDAIDTYRRLIAIRPRYTSAWYNLGLALEDAHRLPEAAEAFETARGLDPAHLLSLRKLARVRRKMGDLPAARGLLEEVVDRAPNDTRARLDLADVCRRGGDSVACLQHAEKALAESPESARGLQLQRSCATSNQHLTNSDGAPAVAPR